jgi:hypothetical protein
MYLSHNWTYFSKPSFRDASTIKEWVGSCGIGAKMEKGKPTLISPWYRIYEPLSKPEFPCMR